MDRVVPVAMKGMALEDDPRQLLIRHVDARRVATAIELGAHAQSRLAVGGSSQARNRREIDERFPPPVPRDVREQPVLDLVPLAGPLPRAWSGDRGCVRLDRRAKMRRQREFDRGEGCRYCEVNRPRSTPTLPRAIRRRRIEFNKPMHLTALRAAGDCRSLGRTGLPTSGPMPRFRVPSTQPQ
jgi:hypothetical protein